MVFSEPASVTRVMEAGTLDSSSNQIFHRLQGKNVEVKRAFSREHMRERGEPEEPSSVPEPAASTERRSDTATASRNSGAVAGAAGAAASHPVTSPSTALHAQQQEAARSVAAQQLVYFESGSAPASTSGGSSISAGLALSSAGPAGNAWSSQKMSLAQRLSTSSGPSIPLPTPSRPEPPTPVPQTLFSSKPPETAISSDVLLPGLTTGGGGSHGGSSRLHDDDGGDDGDDNDYDDDGVASVSTAFLSVNNDDNSSVSAVGLHPLQDGNVSTQVPGGDVSNFLRRLRTSSGTSEMYFSDTGGDGLESVSPPLGPLRGRSESGASVPSSLQLPPSRGHSIADTTVIAPSPSSPHQPQHQQLQQQHQLQQQQQQLQLHIQQLQLQQMQLQQLQQRKQQQLQMQQFQQQNWNGFEPVNHAMLLTLMSMQNQNPLSNHGFGGPLGGFSAPPQDLSGAAEQPQYAFSMPPGLGGGSQIAQGMSDATVASLTQHMQRSLMMQQHPSGAQFPSNSSTDFPPLSTQRPN